MKPSLRVLLAAGLLPLATACMLTEKPVTLNSVGPSPLGEIQQSDAGFLKVYTAMKTYPVDDEMSYRVHTDYGVYMPDGERVKSVRNAATYHDEAPALVNLPPGEYTVEGWADGFQLVKVPITIKAGHLTVVNLEAGHNQRFVSASNDELVRTPDGRIIGWAPNSTPTR